jgi:hypothetical protein
VPVAQGRRLTRPATSSATMTAWRPLGRFSRAERSWPHSHAAGIYDVCDDTDPVGHDRFTEATGWRPRVGDPADVTRVGQPVYIVDYPSR